MSLLEGVYGRETVGTDFNLIKIIELRVDSFGLRSRRRIEFDFLGLLQLLSEHESFSLLKNLL